MTQLWAWTAWGLELEGKKCLISCDVWGWPFCSSTYPSALTWKVDSRGQMKERDWAEHAEMLSPIYTPCEGGLRASWVGKFVFKSLKGLPSLEFVSSPFHQCCLQRKAKSDWVLEKWSYSQAVPAIWTALSSAGWDQQVGVHTPSLGEVGLKTYLLVWPSWHLQWDSRVPTCCSAD